MTKHPVSTSAKTLRLGRATIDPDRPAQAGSVTTIRFRFVAGHPIDDTGAIKVALRFAGDFGVPQFVDPSGPNYCTVQTSGHCRIEPRWDPKGSTRPWDRTLYLKVMGGYLDAGETVTVTFGDTSKGSPGWRLQTFCEQSFEFKTFVDPFATFQFKELPQSPELKIVPGPPARAACIAPSAAGLRQRFVYFLKLEDVWGNPVRKPERRVHPGFSRTGTHTIAISDRRSRLRAVSNPIAVTSEAPALRHYWADLHGQSEETIGTNTVEDYFTFARDYALLDAAAHQGNDFQIDDALWNRINRTTRRFYRRDRFVTLPGYEWSGNTPLGGDRNVWFTDEGGPIIRSCQELLRDPTVFPVASTARDLFRLLRRQKTPQPLVCAHVGGRYADIAMHDPALEFAVEVHSAWGTFEWLVEEAFRRGYRVGICANSDGHKGRPGASYPGAGIFGSYGGLTCILAERLDRPAIVAALRARRFYATTGHRPLINVAVSAGKATARMGEVLRSRSGPARLRATVHGTGPIEHVDIRNGCRLLHRVYATPDDRSSRRFKIVWSGARVRGRDRMVSWDGGLKLKGNAIVDHTPVNFWNPQQQPESHGRGALQWKSTTTGGFAGVILELKRSRGGSLEVTTPWTAARCALDDVGQQPMQWPCGGEAMQFQISRLPDQPPRASIDVDVPIPDLQKGDNPIYLRVTQEDGHMAWTSPVYLVR